MNDYASLDTAIEIMAYKIADCVKKVEEDKTYEKELEKLRHEREEMYSGNIEMINKIGFHINFLSTLILCFRCIY